MDLLGSIIGAMDKPPTPNEREKKMQKAIKAKCDRRLEAEQKRRAKFRAEAEEKVKVFVGDDDKELSFPKVAKVYRAILHDVAEAAGLYSHSLGDGDEKDVVIAKTPGFSEPKPKSPTTDHSSQATPTPTATPPSSDYRQKYQHLIVPSANKRDHRSIEETMNDLRTRKKPRLTTPSSPSSNTTSPTHDT